METLRMLEQMGLELPTPAYIFGVIIFGVIGLVAWRWGRRSGRRPTKWLGVALMLYPYVVARTWMLYSVGVALCIAIFVDQRRP
jgi:hypothetical protein